MRKLALSVSVLAITWAGPSFAETQLNYWLWDSNQQPFYQACAEAFHAAHPDITIKISQFSWGDYWTALTSGFVAGEAPDVFWDHLGRYPEFQMNNQVTDLTPLIQRDKVDMSQYPQRLVDAWSRDGKVYGLPKDWDTIALVYNKDMLDKAGLKPEDLEQLTWNPKDGGTFEKVLAKLTIDANGHDGTSADFDPAHVTQRGLIDPRMDGFGQVQWSHFAVSNGFNFIDHPWATAYHYDDPALADTLSWMRDLSLKKGYMIPQSEIGDLGGNAAFAAGKGALVLDGSWMITWYAENIPFKFGFAPLPTGPKGRKSMWNGLSDAIWTGTQHPEEAWQWVKFLGSSDCQSIVGKGGVVFPAIAAATKLSDEAHAAKGLDVHAFVEEATPEQTFLNPITEHGLEVNSIMGAALDKIFAGNDDAAAILKEANDQVNALFK